ncbi:hypothetical protein EMPG_16104 [Blastomyces silverae]|uniref:Uncharacterized protein n=1 Tax=Blastomyces silverae TaxID=2060906 RepID=A0A0H1BAR4_9EURO|nr:hypothetical protein EMPG_16104 [Blastomyces silverae]
MEPQAYARIPSGTQNRSRGGPDQKSISEQSMSLKLEDVNLLDIFPKNYVRRIKMATASRTAQSEKDTETQSPSEFRTRLDLADSTTVTTLLAEYSLPEEPDGTEQELISFLKKLL